MSPEELRSAEPDALAPLLRALWHAQRDEWEAAHTIAQDVDDADGSWVHAYLHRVEGDLPNARYWYKRAGRPEAQGDLDQEWEALARELGAR